MRRIEKNAPRAEGGAGGPLSKPHAAKAGVKNSVVLSRLPPLSGLRSPEE